MLSVRILSYDFLSSKFNPEDRVAISFVVKNIYLCFSVRSSDRFSDFFKLVNSSALLRNNLHSNSTDNFILNFTNNKFGVKMVLNAFLI